MSGYPTAIANGWHPIATAAELKAKPLARTLMEKPLVAFRAGKEAVVLVDRCPHRNAALSLGRVRDGAIECPYHGWRFGADGRCTLTPGVDTPARHGAEVLPVQERAGLIWTTLAREPANFPPLPYPLEADGFDTFWWAVAPSRARLLDAIENLLDPAHPHFLHAGIVRSGSVRRPVEVIVKVAGDHAQATYVENARASALMPRLLEGLRATSIGRFFPPTIGQLAFEGPKGLRLATTVFFTPEGPDRVRPFAHFATPKGALPALLKEAALRALHIPVLKQDQVMLEQQAENLAKFGARRYALGPIDFLLPAIQALAAGETPAESERRVTVML